MEIGRGLARHQDGEVVEALASEELWELRVLCPKLWKGNGKIIRRK